MANTICMFMFWSVDYIDDNTSECVFLYYGDEADYGWTVFSLFWFNELSWPVILYSFLGAVHVHSGSTHGVDRQEHLAHAAYRYVLNI